MILIIFQNDFNSVIYDIPGTKILNIFMEIKIKTQKVNCLMIFSLQ